ncbi:MAG: Cof-type HAD-IIB family hydrolase [Tuberibacillus sp.]
MKLIATDMDGTLLNAEHEISDENIQALKAAADQGIELAIATGRVHYEVDDYLKRAGLSASIIGTNGATVHTKDRALIYSAPLDKKVLIPMIKELQDRKLFFTVFTEEGIYHHAQGTDWLTEEFERQREKTQTVQDVLRWLSKKKSNTDLLLNDYKEIEQINKTIYKLVVFSYESKKLEEARRVLYDEKRFNIVSSGTGNFEVMHPDATKGKALKALAKHMNIPLQETVAMGDNYNDASMIEAAGIGVAMGNAVEPIKEMASMVTKSNLENGVAYAIYQLLGREE